MIWIVCQHTEGQKPVKVSAWKSRDAAADDAAHRMSKSPDYVHFWLESVEMDDAA